MNPTARIMPLDLDLPLRVSPALENGGSALVTSKHIRDADGQVFNPLLFMVCRPTCYETNIIAERLAKLWRCRVHLTRLKAMLAEMKEKGVEVPDEMARLVAEVESMVGVYMAGGVH